MTKNLFVVIAILSSAILPIFIEAQGFTGYPAVDVPPPMKEEWKLDLSNVPNAPIVAKNKVGTDCPANDPFCNWSCTNCVNNKTDYIQCPDKTALTTQTNEEIIAEIKWTEQIIKQVTGATPIFMRPPYGDIDDRVRSVLTLLGYKVVIWDLDTDDWKSSTDPGFVPESITAKFTEWVKDTTATTGHISLEHDLYPISSKMALPSLDIVLGANFQVEQVAKCISESPYREFTGFPGDNSTSPSPAISSTSASVAMTPTTSLNNNVAITSATPTSFKQIFICM
nr:145_t:CDS:2 [Entrophospora candida]